MYKFNFSVSDRTLAEHDSTPVSSLAELDEPASKELELVLTEQCISAVEKPSHDCQVDAQRNMTKLPGDQQLEQFISNLLKYGVFLASAVVFVGGVLYLIRHGTEPVDYRFFQGEPAVFRSPKGVVTAVLSGRRRGIIQLGLLLLIATPVARVAFSLLAFLRQRDFIYVIVTLFVLAELIYSFIGAYS